MKTKMMTNKSNNNSRSLTRLKHLEYNRSISNSQVIVRALKPMRKKARHKRLRTT